jgi:hypothetical protein
VTAAKSQVKTVYIIDASAIVAFGLHMSEQLDDIFERMRRLAKEGRLKTIDPVIEEVRDHHTNAHKYLKELKDLMVVDHLTEDVAQWNNVIFTQFPKMIKHHKNPSDPFLVALGRINDWTVVSDETSRLRRNRKIPTACDFFKVGHISGLDFKIVLEKL